MSERAPVPPFTAEHERLRLEIRRFVQERLRPHADEWEAAEWFPNEAFAWLAEAGYLGLRFGPEYGGRGDTVAAAVFVEEMARCGSGGLAAGLGAHTGIALPPIAAFGTDEQKERYLVPGLRGELIAALAITEPGAGSDVAWIRTHARRIDGGYLVNGSKTFITGGVRADILVTAVKTDTDPPPAITGSRSSSSSAARASRHRRCANSAGTPPIPPRSGSTTCSCPSRTCSAPSIRAST